MARCPEVNSSGCEPPFLPPSFPQSGTGFAPPISNFYSEISFIFAVNVLYLSCDCRTRLKKRRKRVSFWGSSAIAAYPRKGTITFPAARFLGSPAHCSLSPQGDDNAWCGLHEHRLVDCSLSPQGDDNTYFETHTVFLRNCSLSPQGDDNFIFCSSIILPFYCSLSPQGDDNLPKMPSTGRPSIAAYPRKGTITIPLRRSRPAPPLQLIPARGR
mgnify:CR=1 FL=1